MTNFERARIEYAMRQFGEFVTCLSMQGWPLTFAHVAHEYCLCALESLDMAPARVSKTIAELTAYEKDHRTAEKLDSFISRHSK